MYGAKIMLTLSINILIKFLNLKMLKVFKTKYTTFKKEEEDQKKP